MTTSTVKAPNGSAPLAESDKTTTTTLANSPSNAESEYHDACSCGYEYINPFVHRVNIDNGFDLAKVYVLTILLVPLRAFGCVISLITAWMFACIGLYGVTLEDLKKEPLSGWRKIVKRIVAKSMRLVYAAGSFQYVSFKGERASAKEAPVLVVAPHSSYIDSIVVVTCGPPSIVAKQETSKMPLLGKIINYSQPIYVQREDPNSRHNTIREIIDRATSDKEWPQVAIFPEGTCTNRTALIRFKPGAFYPGVPVQPVLLKYPNKYDTYTWTWDGPGILRLLWLSMAQFYSRCEIEFLPVYVPNEEEKKDANLFAKNVRKVMANALGVPTSEYSFDDVIVMDRAKNWKIPCASDIVEIERKIQKLGLLDNELDMELIASYRSICCNTSELDGLTFAEMLKVDVNNVYYHHLFSLLDKNKRGHVNLKTYLLCSAYLKLVNQEQIKYLRTISPLFADAQGRISRDSFRKLMFHSGVSQEKADILFFCIDFKNRGCIKFVDFENYVEGLPQYQYLYKKLEFVRRVYKN